MGCGAKASTKDPLLGQVVGRGFRLDEVVGSGGMGRVYRAEQVALGRTVAVKVLHSIGAQDPELVRRFEAEARAAGMLDHPNSVGVLDFGRTREGSLFLVMEFIEGDDLASLLESKGRLSPEEALDLLLPALDALAEAHEHGIVHRDLKPENIMLAQSAGGRTVVKVVDFGLARLRSASKRTAPGTIFGTPEYMAPEQAAAGKEVDARADLYSVGILLYELLTGRVPFEAPNPVQLLMKHMEEEPPDPLSIAPDLPPVFGPILRKALEKKPEERFQTASQMRAALETVRAAVRSLPDLTRCRACGASNAGTTRFCGTCGAPVLESFRAPPRSEQVVVPMPVPEGPSPFVGRHRELTALDELSLRERSAWAHVHGPVGSGRSRFLEEYAKRAEKAGNLVVRAAPHPLRLPLPYQGVQALLAQLVEASTTHISGAISSGHSFGTALVHAGMVGAVDGVGVAGRPFTSRAGAVRAALGAALRAQCQRAGARRALVVVDDFTEQDPLTREVLANLGNEELDVPFLLLTAGAKVALPATATLGLRPLGAEPLRDLASHAGVSDLATELLARANEECGLPLYLEELGRLDPDARALLTSAPTWPRLADLVASRVGSLDNALRRALQGAALIGRWGSLDHLERALPDGEAHLLDTPAARSWLVTRSGRFSFHHPLMRDVLAASVPVSRKKTWHGALLDAAKASDDAIEVRAHHAAEGGHPAAPLLLDTAGRRAALAGEPRAAYRAYAAALDLARAGALAGNDLMADAAWTFLSRAAEALAAAGRDADADALLSEAEGGLPTGDERRTGLRLQRVRAKLAQGLLDDAQGLVEDLRQGDASPAVRAQIHEASARLHRARGDLVAARSDLERAAATLEPSSDEEACVRVLLDLADVLQEAGSIDQAERALASAQRRPGLRGRPALESQIVGRLGRCLVGRDREEGVRLLRDAARLAAEAGDEPLHLAWRAEADAFG